MSSLEPLRFMMVTDGRIATTSILDAAFRGLHRQGLWDYESYYLNERNGQEEEIKVAVTLADTVLFVRSTRWGDVDLMRLAQGAGIPTIYCLDDDFDSLDPASPLGAVYLHPDNLTARHTLIREADQVWVFTAGMARRLEQCCRSLHLCRAPSFVENQGWSLPAIEAAERDDSILKIGYGGASIHQQDLEVVVEPLRRILDASNGGVVAEFIDCIPSTLKMHPQVRHVPYFERIQDYHTYLRQARWSVGLAPLRDTAANRAKTNNKYREYAALGIPGIYSEESVYSSCVRHLETGYLTAHTEKGMHEALTRMLSDPELRRRIRLNALLDAATTYASLPMEQEWLREVSLLASRKQKKIQLLVVANSQVATTQIDALPACRQLEREGRMEFTHLEPAQVTRECLNGPDAVFLVRAFEPEMLTLLEWAKAADVPLICAYDDDFSSPPPDSALSKYLLHPAVRRARARFLRECALVVATTPPLAERSREFSPNVSEAIYGFDTFQLPVEPLAEAGGEHVGPLKVGFFGLQWATAPACVTAALRRIKGRFPKRVQLELITGAEVPSDCKDLFDWHSAGVRDWAASLRLLRQRDWDVGLAPLCDSVFTASKQATKFRDYAWAGLAIVCSNVPAYKRVVIDGLHGLLVNDTEEEWEAAISRLVQDEELLLRLRKGARDLFCEAHTLDATICSWYQLMWRVARRSEGRRAASRPLGRSKAFSSSRPEEKAAAAPLPAEPVHASGRLAGRWCYCLVPEADGWDSLEVLTRLHQTATSGRVTLSIYSRASDSTPLRQVCRELGEAVENTWLEFRFTPIRHSRGMSALVCFDLEGTAPRTQVSLYERGRASRPTFVRALRSFSKWGGALYCRLGYG